MGDPLAPGEAVLVCQTDIQGDLHCHTLASDGRNTIEDMVRAARERGYSYLGITDHTQNSAIANGLDADRLARQIDEIDALDGFRVLKASEVDILENGLLDLPDSILGRLEYTVCSVHTAFDLPRERQTERILRAMDNPAFSILGHPTGRLAGICEAYPVDLERVFRGARERGCFVELNARPERLDLDEANCRMAKALGVKVAISTDAHHERHLAFIRSGVEQARRAGLLARDVLNTRSWPQLQALFQRS
jgi:DNA polymerase (family 10)